MSQSAGLDVLKLIEPIPGEHPTGVNLEDDPQKKVLIEIRGLRDQCREIEKKKHAHPPQEGSHQEGDAYDPSQLRWDVVRDRCAEALTAQSKDFRLAMWLCEALLGQDGYRGLLQGLTATRGLIERYWDSMYPALADGDPEPRLKVFTNTVTSKAFVASIKEVPLTEREGYTLLECEESQLLKDVVDPEQRRKSVGTCHRDVTIGQFEAEVLESSPEFLRGVIGAARDCRSELEQLVSLLQGKCSDPAKAKDGVPMPRDALRAFQDAVGAIVSRAGDRLASPPPSAEPETAPGGGGEDPGPSSPSPPRVLDRVSAFEQLLRLADFFAASEPHSPVSYHIRQSVKWGSMPLPELLAELIQDEKVCQSVFLRVGIVSPSGEESP